MMFLKYLPEVVRAGKLYAANPPLYGVSVGKGKMKFFNDNIDYVEYVQSIFCKENQVANINGKALTKSEIIKLLCTNIDYLTLVTHVSNTYTIDPVLLEFLLYNKDLTFAKFKSAVEKQYKFTTVTKENGVIMIHGLVGSLYQTVFFNDRLLNECKPIIDLINRSYKFYILNGMRTTLYGIMYAFSKAEPSGITRYKGLGKTFCPLIRVTWCL